MWFRGKAMRLIKFTPKRQSKCAHFVRSIFLLRRVLTIWWRSFENNSNFNLFNIQIDKSKTNRKLNLFHVSDISKGQMHIIFSSLRWTSTNHFTSSIFRVNQVGEEWSGACHYWQLQLNIIIKKIKVIRFWNICWMSKKWRNPSRDEEGEGQINKLKEQRTEKWTC